MFETNKSQEQRTVIVQRDVPARKVPDGTRITIPKNSFVNLRQALGGTYTVTINGSIADIKIISADPPRIFNKAATRALLKWKYKPKVVDGKAVPYNQSTTLDFIIKK